MPPAISLKTVTNNVGWSVLSKTTTFGLKFVTVPILARILSPEEFGAVAVAQTVVIFLAMIGSAGLAASLVLKHGDAGAYSAANRFSSIPNQVVLAALMGVYAVLVLLTERELLRKLLQLLREERATAANAGAGG